MQKAKRSTGPQTASKPALSKELIGILAVGATLMIGQISAYAMIQAEFTDVRTEIAGLRDEMHTEIGGVRAEIGSLRDEMHAEIGGVRAEIGSLRDEMHAEIGGVRAEIGSLRDEMHAEIGSVRAEIGGLRDEMRTEIGGLREDVVDLRERMARVETHVAIMREDIAYLVGRRESPSQAETQP